MTVRTSIGNIEVGDGLPSLLIAEIGLNHNGSVELARDMIKAAALSGASMVKFQKRSPADLATAHFIDQPFLKCPLFGKTQREVRNRLEFNIEQLKELKEYSEKLGLLFSMSVFDIPSLQTAIELGLPVVKIASHSITNAYLLKEVAKSKLPVILSMGASTWEERDKAYEILKNNPLVILHCVSAYPCPESLVKIDTINEIRNRYNCVAGYSGHESGIDISVAATVVGASIIERHFTLNRSMVGLDHQLSLEPHEFSEMARRIRSLEKTRGVVEGIAREELPSRMNYHVSVCTKRNMKNGEVISLNDIICKQPLGAEGVNFSGLELDLVIGRRLIRDLEADTPIPRDAVV